MTELHIKRKQCYICHKPLIAENKWFCPECERLNESKKNQLPNENLLKGKIAIVTGGRIKIGYETGLKLLRNGAFVILTTRFPVDAAFKYANEPDFENWNTRLKIYKIDFRNILQVEEFASFIDKNLTHLDILINNAAQTVRRPKEYYEHLKELENKEIRELPSHIKQLIYENNFSLNFFNYQENLDKLQITKTTDVKMLVSNQDTNYFPKGKIDTNGETLDLREKNSWTSKAEDISAVEMLEVQLINVTAPFLLCARLKETMKRSPNKHRFIINVSAMEGKFNKKNKNAFHPHTNMAKAALNMLTRTSAQDYKKDNIYMNSVDTGWITDENPYHLQIQNGDNGITPPLNSKDGAARVCDPIFYSLQNNKFSYGRFFKDFKITSW